MASALKLFALLVVPSLCVGCYAPDVFEVSSKLSSQCGLSLSAPACVDPADEAVMERLWERFVLAEITSPEVEACVLAMECNGEENTDPDTSTSAALNACMNVDGETKSPTCMWQCLSSFLECTPAEGESCHADFVEGCLDTREACEHRC